MPRGENAARNIRNSERSHTMSNPAENNNSDLAFEETGIVDIKGSMDEANKASEANKFPDGENGELSANLKPVPEDRKGDIEFRQLFAIENAKKLNDEIVGQASKLLSDHKNIEDVTKLKEIMRQLEYTQKEIEYSGMTSSEMIPEIKAVEEFQATKEFVGMLINNEDYRKEIAAIRKDENEEQQQALEQARQIQEAERNQSKEYLVNHLERVIEEIQIDQAIVNADLQDINERIQGFNLAEFEGSEIALARAEQYINSLKLEKRNLEQKQEALRVQLLEEQRDLIESSPGDKAIQDTRLAQIDNGEIKRTESIGDNIKIEVEKAHQLIFDGLDPNLESIQAQVDNLTAIKEQVQNELALNKVRIENNGFDSFMKNYQLLETRLQIFGDKTSNLLKARQEQLQTLKEVQAIEEQGGMVIVDPEIDQYLLDEVKGKIDLEEIKNRARGAKLLEGETSAEFAFRQSIDEIERHNKELSTQLELDVEQANALQVRIDDLEADQAGIDLYYDQKASFSFFKSLRSLFDAVPAEMKKRKIRKEAEGLKDELAKVQGKLQESAKKIATNKAAKTYLEMQLPNQSIQEKLQRTHSYLDNRNQRAA